MYIKLFKMLLRVTLTEYLSADDCFFIFLRTSERRLYWIVWLLYDSSVSQPSFPVFSFMLFRTVLTRNTCAVAFSEIHKRTVAGAYVATRKTRFASENIFYDRSSIFFLFFFFFFTRENVTTKRTCGVSPQRTRTVFTRAVVKVHSISLRVRLYAHVCSASVHGCLNAERCA